MDSFKIENFKRHNPNDNFPWFESLGPNETERLRSALTKKAGLDGSVNSLELTKRLYQMSKVVNNIDSEDDNFDLYSLTKQLGIKARKYAYVDWYRYERIDRLTFVSLSRNFSDIWYPGSNDISIFDSSTSWIINVMHYGTVSAVKLSVADIHGSS
jgi:hypothetical protein